MEGVGYLQIHPLCLCSFVHKDMHVHLQHVSTTTRLDVGCFSLGEFPSKLQSVWFWLQW